MRFSLDTNVLIYATAAPGDIRQAAAERILRRAAELDCVLTTQSLQEYYSVTVRKQMALPAAARRSVADMLRAFPTQPAAVTVSSLTTAMIASAERRFSFWDALLLASAGEAGCGAVISEEMQPGAFLGHVRVVPAFDRSGTVAAETIALLAGEPPHA